jgi:hypothetical protein
MQRSSSRRQLYARIAQALPRLPQPAMQRYLPR